MRVDPFIVPIPAKYLNDPEVAPFFRYLNRFLHDLWKRTGGGDDLIETTINQTIAGDDTNPAAFADILQRLDAMDEANIYTPPMFREYNAVTKNRDYSAAPYDFVNAKSNARITLPTWGSVIVRNGDGSKIEVVAENSRKINGENIARLRRQNTALFFQYFIDSDEWLVR